MRRLVLLAALAVVFAGCLGSDFADSLEGSWRMTSGTVDGEAIPILIDYPITLDIEGDEVSGTASCNSYSGSYELDGSDIAFADLAMTEMACVEEDAMTAEFMYGQGLARADTVTVDNGLVLGGNGVELVFEPVE